MGGVYQLQPVDLKGVKTMTNKEYKARREEHENAYELSTFEKWDGYSFRPSYYVDTEDKRELRAEYKEDKKRGAYALDGFNGRAVIIPDDDGEVLKSYYTPVCKITTGGEFVKLWEGYSATTMKHINAFRTANGFRALSKRAWIEL